MARARSKPECVQRPFGDLKDPCLCLARQVRRLMVRQLNEMRCLCRHLVGDLQRIMNPLTRDHLHAYLSSLDKLLHQRLMRHRCLLRSLHSGFKVLPSLHFRHRQTSASIRRFDNQRQLYLFRLSTFYFRLSTFYSYLIPRAVHAGSAQRIPHDVFVMRLESRFVTVSCEPHLLRYIRHGRRRYIAGDRTYTIYPLFAAEG